MATTCSCDEPRPYADTLVHVVAAGGRCVVEPNSRAPKSAQEIELERYLRERRPSRRPAGRPGSRGAPVAPAALTA